MSADFNIREFYRESVAKEEADFVESTGLSIRHHFQQYNEGGDNEEVFAVKTFSKKNCFGLEFCGSISYLVPINYSDVLVFIFDGSLMSVINNVSNWSEARIKKYGNYVPSLMNALENAVNGDLSTIGIFVDEDMLCFAKQIEYNFFEKMEEGYIAEPSLFSEILSLVQYRNTCAEEITSFNGFTAQDENDIVFKEAISSVKKGLRYMRLMNYISPN